MTTPFSEWLGLLAKAEKGPAELPTAVRGQAYEHFLSVEGDKTAAVLTGQVRSAPDADTAIVTFSIDTPTFADGYTTWAYSLLAGSGANSTGAFPVDDSLTGVQYFPYDFLLTNSGGTKERLIGGLIPVSGHITEPS